jgi:hypothetical protein
MVVFILLFLSVVLFFGLLFIEIARSDKRAQAKGYGPKSQISGEPCAKGHLNCVSYKAPTLGQSISYNFALRLYSDKGDVTGIFEHIQNPKDFSGSLFLSFSGGQVKGRSLMGGLQVCEGAVGTGGARLTRGQPKGGMLGLFNGSFEYSVRGGAVHFDKTTSPGSISKDSQLLTENGRISGRVFHGPQKTWAVDVDVSFSGIKNAAALLAVILACDHILCQIHSGVFNTIDD